MDTRSCQPSCCSRCRHYTPEGRRGGHCSQLGVPVQSGWSACSLGVPVFMAAVPALDPLELLPQPIEIHFPEPPLAPDFAPGNPQPVPSPALVQHR
jgi:hypothetical protein